MPACSRDAPNEAMTLAHWNKVISVHLTGQFLCAREAIREFRRAARCGTAGKSFAGRPSQEIPWAGHVNYAAAKGGVAAMMQHARPADEHSGFLDVGTSGGPGGARTSACFMVGGERTSVSGLEPILQELAGKGGYVHAGGPRPRPSSSSSSTMASKLACCRLSGKAWTFWSITANGFQQHRSWSAPLCRN